MLRKTKKGAKVQRHKVRKAQKEIQRLDADFADYRYRETERELATDFTDKHRF